MCMRAAMHCVSMRVWFCGSLRRVGEVPVPSSIAGAGRPTDVGDLLWQRKSYRGAVLCEGHSADGHDMRPKVWVTRAPSE